MFSWIIEHKAKILTRDGWRFTIENTFTEELTLGQSIAHDWACMTLTGWNSDSYEFFVMEESLMVTNFWTKKVWDFFNVERSLKLGDRIDGHMVTGHIDIVGKVLKTEKKEDNSLILTVSFDKKFSSNIVKKGSITINWVSLTIVDTEDESLSVSLIPLTQDWTNLGNLNNWDSVNLEFDMLGKYVQRILQNK
jgi:riboflavin synthase